MAETKNKGGTQASETTTPPAAPPVVERPDEKAHNVLTSGMPVPPGLRDRRARRKARKVRKGPFVKYVGAASHRIIRPADWAQLGFEPKSKDAGHLTFAWNPQNDYMVETDKFTDEQLDYLLIDDVQHGTNVHSFLEVDYDDDGQLVQVLDEEE